jgi:hypothetical protein
VLYFTLSLLVLLSGIKVGFLVRCDLVFARL